MKIKEKAKEFDAYAVGLVSASVCTSLPLAEATKRLNLEHPTGIDSQWSKSKDKMFRESDIANGGACEQNPATHKHYLFNC